MTYYYDIERCILYTEDALRSEHDRSEDSSEPFEDWIDNRLSIHNGTLERVRKVIV